MLHIKQRFLDNIEPVPESGCWLWIGSTFKSQGYGRITYKQKYYRAHRLSYMLYNGPVPVNMQVCHTCDVGLCVNPMHLWLGTGLDNMHDKCVKNRHSFRFTPAARNNAIKSRRTYTNEQIEQVLNLHKTRLSYPKIGKLVNLRPITVWRIVTQPESQRYVN